MDFNALLSKSIQPLEAFSSCEIALPPQFARAERAEKTGLLQLDNRFVSVGDLGQFRGLCISSPKINIVSMFFFPKPHWQLPLFVMELVLLGSRPIVAMVDAVCLLSGMCCGDTVKAILERAHEAFSHLQQADDPPQWYVECRSGHDFFVRPDNIVGMEEMARVHLNVWGAVVDLFSDPRHFPRPQIAESEKRIQAYKEHHRVNSPGLRLMNRSFGERWTQDYLCDYLFH